MGKSLTEYLSQLTEEFGNGWNQFWFRPCGVWHLTLLRVLVGILGLLWLASYSFSLVDWFGPHGVLPASTVYTVVTGGDNSAPVFGFSYLYLMESPVGLWITHVLAMAVVLLFTLGIAPRRTGLLSLAVALSYIHRAPLITGHFEPVFCMLLAYLCLAPTFKLTEIPRGVTNSRGGAMANVATRLIQVHLAAIYLMIGLTKLGHPTWWMGEASWQLISQSQTRLIDLSFLRQSPFLLDAITHGWVLFDLLYGVLIWHRLLRPLLIGLSVLVWVGAAMITGLVGLAAIMIVANLAFIPSEVVANWFSDKEEEQVRNEGFGVMNALGEHSESRRTHRRRNS